MTHDAQEFSVQDGQRLISFEGYLLGESSSERPQASRWSEYRLYRTTAGSYVFEKIGRSIVVHRPECSLSSETLRRFQEVNPGQDPQDGWWFCETCCLDGYDITSLQVEDDRCHVTIAEDADGAIEAMYRRRNGTKSLQSLTLDLLERASVVDPDVAAAYRVERLA